MLLVNTAVRVILRVGKLRAGSEMLGKIRHQSQRHMKSGMLVLRMCILNEILTLG